ncbi:MAG: aspartate kinase [Proteobacteria bacterium]|nr:aspartate kinase [Pseudomonadota bacterium]
MKNLIVQKYGGTSVGSIDRIRHVARHIAATVKGGSRVVAVVSAMGEQTDELLAMAHEISPAPPRRELDMLLTAGERISMALMSIALNEEGTHAVSLTGSQSGIITDTTHGNARISKILGHRIQSSLTQGHVVIVAGFQGVSQDSKEITTLGRGGSDLSAIALAGYLGANGCQLFKDVDGVFTADPRVVPEAHKIQELSWDSMTEMAWVGASVLHPRAAHLASKYEIPVEIRSSFNLERSGTLVSGRAPMEQFVVRAITHRNHMVLISGRLKGSGNGLLNQLRSWMWGEGEVAQIQSQTSGDEGSFGFFWSMPESLLGRASALLQGQESGQLLMEQLETVPCALVTIVGGGFWQSPELIPSIQQFIPGAKFLEVKNTAITIAMNQADVEKALRDLHKALLG